MKSFSAKVNKIGVNPYVIPPKEILDELFVKAGKNTSPIPVRVTLARKKFPQHLVKYSGKWRLYLNTPMRKAAKLDVGDLAKMHIEFDPKERAIPMHPKLEKAFQKNKKAFKVFEQLSPYKKKEIVRYISFLKSEDSVDRNVKRAIEFLLGKGRFIGRDNP